MALGTLFIRIFACSVALYDCVICFSMYELQMHAMLYFYITLANNRKHYFC